MAEKQIEFSGKSGVAALLVVLAFVAFRIISFDRNTSPELREAVMTELRNEMGGALQNRLNETKGEEDYDELSDLANDELIRIYSIYVSEPLLSWSSNQKAIVKVTFRLPAGKRRTEYYRFNHRVLDDWQYERPSSSYKYYSNFF